MVENTGKKFWIGDLQKNPEKGGCDEIFQTEAVGEELATGELFGWVPTEDAAAGMQVL
jgi:hypothetical protein